MPQTLALAEVAAAALMLLGEQIHAVLGQHRHREVGAVEAIHEDDVARSQMGYECAEQCLLAAAFAATRAGCPAQHRPGRQRDERHQYRQRETKTGLLFAALRIHGLIGLGVGH